MVALLSQLDLQVFIPTAVSAIVSVVSVITSAIVQFRSHKKENERVALQNEHLRKLEQLRFEGEMEKAKLEQRLKESASQREEIIQIYGELVNACFGEDQIDVTRIFMCFLKLTGLCPRIGTADPNLSMLHFSLDKAIYGAKKGGLSEEDIRNIRYGVECLSTKIFKIINPSEIAQSTSRPDMPQQQ